MWTTRCVCENTDSYWNFPMKTVCLDCGFTRGCWYWRESVTLRRVSLLSRWLVCHTRWILRTTLALRASGITATTGSTCRTALKASRSFTLSTDFSRYRNTGPPAKFIKKLKLKPNKALDKNSFLSYGTSPAIWYHIVLPVTQHKWTRPALTPASKLVIDLPPPEGWKAELT